MPCKLCLLVIALLPAFPAVQQPPQSGPVQLEVRVFDGLQEVTNQTRVAIYPAGERNQALAAGRRQLQLNPGVYDVQVLLERDGRTMSIRWAEQLMVMWYPDEAGRHLEVVNLQPEYGALQVRWKPERQEPSPPDTRLYPTGAREGGGTPAHAGDEYLLFVVPAGQYDLVVLTDTPGQQTLTRAGIEVPLDRTRLIVLP